MKLRIKITTGRFAKPLICAKCGAELPAEVKDVNNKAVIAVFCKHCKAVTVMEIEK